MGQSEKIEAIIFRPWLLNYSDVVKETEGKYNLNPGIKVFRQRHCDLGEYTRRYLGQGLTDTPLSKIILRI